ncbi:MAG TPA: GNAT family N-acetyltransferase [Marmoricola sp.]|nr:GNAT family N-acetyltransferase [Marmoricola sp.]
MLIDTATAGEISVFPRLTAADALLSDGTIITIRPLRADDAESLTALNEGLATESLRYRFFGVNRAAAHQYAQHLLASPEVPSLVAEHAGELIGIASAEPLTSRTYEVAFIVADRWHGLGAGSLLLEHLAALARDRGIDKFIADVLLENRPMLEVFARAGFRSIQSTEQGVTHLELETGASPDYLRAADAREFASERSSLRGLLHPRSIAVYGARHDGSGIGATVLHSITDGGFSGPVYVVHPKGGSFPAATAVRSLAEADHEVDLALIALPAGLVLAALQDVANAHTGVAVLISSGFAEMGKEGARLQQDILDFARTHDIRLVGPNCLGVAISDGVVHLDATFGPAMPAAGKLAIASQSGGVGIALMDQARSLGLGVGAFVSLGNKCDVSGNDLLAAWLEDDTVDAAALYLESFGNAAKFARIARRFSQRKPLLAVVGGQSTSGHRAGASHTAAAATPSAGVNALFRQSGVIQCADEDELATTALLMTQQPLPQGPRLAILSNAGGMGCLAADNAERLGLEVPELSVNASDAISQRVRGTIGVGNPVDAGAGIDADDFGAIAQRCLASEEVDALLVVIVSTALNDGSTLASELANLGSIAPFKPVVLVPMGGLQALKLEIPGVTIQPTIRSATQAIASAAAYAHWRSRQEEAFETADIHRATHTRALVAAFTSPAERPASRDGWLDVIDSCALLEPYGLSPSGVVAVGRDAILRTAASLGYPVAAKIAEGGLTHKTERGLVRLGLDESALDRTIDEWQSELARTEFPVLVQPMVEGLEIALGVVRDPSFGPLLMVGAGGITTDLSDDRAFLIPPLTRGEVDQALRGLRLWPLLAGYRGGTPRDVQGLQDAILHLSSLMEEVPEVAELDFNPVIVGPDRCHLVDVRIRIGQPGIDAGVPRRLRER